MENLAGNLTFAGMGPSDLSLSTPTIALTAACGGALILFGISAFSGSKCSHLKVPFVSGGVPYLGNALSMTSGSPWDTMTGWAAKYGRVYVFRLFGSDCLCISDAELLKVILQTKQSIFKKDLEWVYRPFLVILGNGLVTADGDSWFAQRKLLSKHLRTNILQYIPDMAMRAYQRLVVKLEHHKRTKEPINMAEEFRHLTLQVIAEAVLSITAEESDRTFAHMYLPIVEEGNLRTWDPSRQFLPTPAWFSFRTAVQTLNNYVTGIIVKRWNLRQAEAKSGKAHEREHDVLDTILGAVDPEDWNEATIAQICGEVKTFILAGHETSASMLTWSLFELSLNKTLRQQVIDNADSVFTGDNRVAAGAERFQRLLSQGPVERDEVLSELGTKLYFTECCLREALRKYSNVPSVVRVASEDVDVGSLKVRKGTTIMINIQGVHHDPEYWPDPLRYDPMRFHCEDGSFSPQGRDPYTFLPFIEGRRMCLGQFLALLESKIVLSLVVQNYSFECVNVEEASKRHSFMVPIIPQNGHWMIVS
jgi:cytochrome P450